MDKALHDRTQTAAGRGLDWRKRMSDHVAYALLVYTALQIFVTMGALKTGKGSVLPYFALVVLIAAIIPACRHMERNWEGLTNAEAADPALRGTFWRDAGVLWACAFGLPFLVTFGYKLISPLI